MGDNKRIINYEWPNIYRFKLWPNITDLSLFTLKRLW